MDSAEESSQTRRQHRRPPSKRVTFGPVTIVRIPTACRHLSPTAVESNHISSSCNSHGESMDVLLFAPPPCGAVSGVVGAATPPEMESLPLFTQEAAQTLLLGSLSPPSPPSMMPFSQEKSPELSLAAPPPRAAGTHGAPRQELSLHPAVAEAAHVCVFCGEGDGELTMHSGQQMHLACALWCPEVYYDAAEGGLQNLSAALERCRLIKCAHCRRTGAATGCVVESCQRSYHLHCAIRAGAWLNEEVFELYCPKHRT